MELLVSYFLVGCLIQSGIQSVKMEECIFNKLAGEDKRLCRGDLEILYPELGDVGCSYIPNCNAYRKRISREWRSPEVKYQQANVNMRYVLIMVDPDAPSRYNPKYRFWRHWVVTDIRGIDLMTGNPQGRVISDYRRPTPPPDTGYHRYQFLLYEQPDDETISLSPDEIAFSGSWNLRSFVDRFQLGTPVASTQFITKNYRD